MYIPQVQNTLDPLLAALTREYVDDADLTTRLNALFRVSRVSEGVPGAGRGQGKKLGVGGWGRREVRH